MKLDRLAWRSGSSGRLWAEAAGYDASAARLPVDARLILWGDNKAVELASGALASAREAKMAAALVLARLATHRGGAALREAAAVQ